MDYSLPRLWISLDFIILSAEVLITHSHWKKNIFGVSLGYDMQVPIFYLSQKNL